MNDTEPSTRLARITDKIDRPVANAIAIRRGGGVAITTMAEVMEVSKMMAIAQQAVPKHLREQPGLCFGIVMQALAWEMEPFAVARKSFVVNDTLAYESQLIHAVIEARAPIKGRLRCRYSGEGPDRQCIVYGTFDGETEPHDYTTPKFKDIPIKNSPLWKWDIDQQMFYFGSRAWARKWCPDVLLGVYSPDETAIAGEGARDVTPHATISNPLQDDSEIAPKLIDPVSANAITRPEPDDGAIVHDDGSVTRPSVADTPQPATPPRQARRKAADAPKPAEAVQGPPPEKTHQQLSPDASKAADAVKFTNPIRYGGPEYLPYLRKWTELAPSAEYVEARFKSETSLRNQLGTPLTAEERAEAATIRNAAVDRLRGGV